MRRFRSTNGQAFILVALLLAAATGATSCAPQGRDTTMQPHDDNETNGPPEPLETLFTRCVRLSGDAYLGYEAKLRARGPDALAFLRNRQAELDDTSFEAFVAGALAAWLDGHGDEYGPAMAELRAIEQRMATTPAGTPRVAAVAAALTRVADDRLVDVLALRLVKEPAWYTWKALGVLLYLEQHQATSALPALLRYAEVTKEEPRRAAALRVIAALEAR